MRKAAKHTDPRFGKWPKVRQRDGEISMSMKVLTSRRMFVLKKLLFRPSEVVWKLVAKISVVELLCFLARFCDAFSVMPFTRLQFYLLLIGVSLVWYWEKLKGNKITRFIFGKRLRVSIDREKLQTGGWLFRKAYSREQRLMFSTESFFKAHDEIYQASQRLCLIVGDARRIEIMEVFGTLEISKLVNNLNTALRLTDPDNRDPYIAQSRRKPASKT